MIVLGIHCNFFTVFSIRLKTCRPNGFLFFTRQNVRSGKIGRVSVVLRSRAHLIGIGRGVCLGLE